MSSDAELWYFAYGANMDSRTLVERRKIVPGASHRARLPGFELVFNQRGIPWIEPAFANIRSAENSQVHGVAYLLTASQMEVLDALEGGGAYDHLTVDLELETGQRLSATTYVTTDTVDGALPSIRYMGLLIQGANEHQLPEPWVDRLREQPTAGLKRLAFMTPVIMRAFEVLFRGQLVFRRWLGR